MVKKTISVVLVLMMLLATATPISSYGVAKDYAGHWAGDKIQLWLDKGYVTGYPDGSFNPEGKVTRSEFVTMVNSVFNYTEVADINFTDVESNKWYYQEVQKAFKANYIAGTSETQFAPNENLTREQAAVIVSKIMKLDENPSGVEKFKDANEISTWAKNFVGAAAQAELINGYNDSTFKPQNPISRAEAIIILNNSLNGSQSADLIIDKAGIVVENKTFRNIHITNRVGNGEVTLKNVVITGELLVEGGGLNSIIIEDSIVNKLTVNKADGKVRILLIGETAIDVTSIESGATLEQQQLTGTGFSRVIVDEDVDEFQVLTISADMDNLTVKAKIKINVKTGTIENIKIEKTAEGASVNLEKDATVLLVTIDIKVAFTGTGAIVSANINVNSVTFEQEPKKTNLAPGVSKPVIQPSSSSSSNGGKSSTVINIKAYGNEFEIGTYNEFLTGQMNNISLKDNIGDGALTLKAVDGKYPTNGEYISQIIDVPNFEYMVASWNSDTPEGTYVEIQAKVLVNHFDENNQPIQTWTEWLSWGQWSPFIVRASADTNGILAETSVDELVVKGSDGETASKVQMKVILHTDNPLVTPTVRYLHGTLKNTMNPISKEFKETIDVTNLNKNIITPTYSQMIRCPRIKNSICSATTITMIMNRFGEKLLPEEVAQNTYDDNYGWGNWAFAMASTGSYGYKSYVDYTTIEGLKREIAKGYPVGVSVKYSNVATNTKYPYVEGSPGVTPGHLIVVTGFETIDGVEYVLVNDSYAPENETVSRKYKLDQFEKAWSNRVAYIVHDKEVNAGSDHTMRIDAKLVETDVVNEYKVYVNDVNINVQNFGGTIAYTFDDDLTYEYFPKITNKNSLTFTCEDIKNPKLKIYVITDTGKVYITSTVLSESAKVNLLAVAEAKEAVVGGSIDVAFDADQTAKTAAVLNYINNLTKNEVTAVVSYVSDKNYKVELTKGSASDNKIITMVVNIADTPNEDQLAPTGLAGVAPTSALTDGKITGTTIDMEYKLVTDEDSRYTACSATETIVESAGDYLLRFAAKTGFNPGATVVVNVPAYVEDTKTLLSIGEINGKAQVGVVLTPGLVLPLDATYSFQWKISSAVDGVYTDITDATTNTYTPVEEDVGKFIKVSAIGAGSSGYTGTVTSVATEAVAPVVEPTN